ncbi:unnamed protein product, partial [Tilletia controversa]
MWTSDSWKVFRISATTFILHVERARVLGAFSTESNRATLAGDLIRVRSAQCTYVAANPPPKPSGSHHTLDEPSSSSTPQPKQEDPPKNLTRERTTMWQELEIDRILSAFKLNPYSVLDVHMEADSKEITKVYRKKSLLLHPDKVKHERAVEAFDLLKKASTHLLDEDKRKNLDETVMAARIVTLKEL